MHILALRKLWWHYGNTNSLRILGRHRWDCISTSLLRGCSTPAFSIWALNKTFRARINLLCFLSPGKHFQTCLYHRVTNFKIFQSSLSFFFLFFFFQDFIYLFLEKREGRKKRRRETLMCESSFDGLSICPQPTHVPWLGIELVTFWFTGRPHQPEQFSFLMSVPFQNLFQGLVAGAARSFAYYSVAWRQEEGHCLPAIAFASDSNLVYGWK